MKRSVLKVQDRLELFLLHLSAIITGVNKVKSDDLHSFKMKLIKNLFKDGKSKIIRFLQLSKYFG